MSFIKTRRLKVRGAADTSTLQGLIAREIETIPGVIKVEIEGSANAVVVTYDVRETNLNSIEQALARVGLTVARNWIQRISRGLISYMEENERDNALAPASPCCSHPDALLQKGKHNHSAHVGR